MSGCSRCGGCRGVLEKGGGLRGQELKTQKRKKLRVKMGITVKKVRR